MSSMLNHGHHGGLGGYGSMGLGGGLGGDLLDDLYDDDRNGLAANRINQNLASRNYRQRKKDYIKEIEAKLASLTFENHQLKRENESLKESGGVEVMRPEPELVTMLMEGKQIIIQMSQAIKKNDERTLVYLLHLFHVAIAKRYAIAEREVEKIVHPYTQSKLAAMGYVPRNDRPLVNIMGPASDGWFSLFKTEACLTDEQSAKLEALRGEHDRQDNQLRVDREQLDREIKKFYHTKILVLPNSPDDLGDALTMGPVQTPSLPYPTANEATPIVNSPLEISQILDFARKLECLKKNFIRQRNLMMDTLSSLSTILTPKQEAMLLVRVHFNTTYDFAHMELLKDVWTSIVNQNKTTGPKNIAEALAKFTASESANIMPTRVDGSKTWKNFKPPALKDSLAKKIAAHAINILVQSILLEKHNVKAAAAALIKQISSTNYEELFGRITQILHSMVVGGKEADPSLITQLELVAHLDLCAVELARLFERCTLSAGQIRGRNQRIALASVLYRAVHTWIRNYTQEFVALSTSETNRLPGSPDIVPKLFEIILSWSKKTQIRASTWPLLTSLLILCPDILRSIATRRQVMHCLAQCSIAGLDISDKAGELLVAIFKPDVLSAWYRQEFVAEFWDVISGTTLGLASALVETRNQPQLVLRILTLVEDTTTSSKCATCIGLLCNELEDKRTTIPCGLATSCAAYRRLSIAGQQVQKGRQFQQKVVRAELRSIETNNIQHSGAIQAWEEVYSRWTKIDLNSLVLAADSMQEWYNILGFLCSLCSEVPTNYTPPAPRPALNRSPTSRIPLLKNYASRKATVAENLHMATLPSIDRFMDEMMTLIVSDITFVRESTVSLLGSALNVRMFSAFGRHVQERIKSFSSLDRDRPVLEINDRYTLFIENSIKILDNLVGGAAASISAAPGQINKISIPRLEDFCMLVVTYSSTIFHS
eukprot:gene10707-12453_t